MFQSPARNLRANGFTISGNWLTVNEPIDIQCEILRACHNGSPVSLTLHGGQLPPAVLIGNIAFEILFLECYSEEPLNQVFSIFRRFLPPHSNVFVCRLPIAVQDRVISARAAVLIRALSASTAEWRVVGNRLAIGVGCG
jgi:hypothetical protein